MNHLSYIAKKARRARNECSILASVDIRYVLHIIWLEGRSFMYFHTIIIQIQHYKINSSNDMTEIR